MRGVRGLSSFFNGVKNSPRWSLRNDSRMEAGVSFKWGYFVELFSLAISLTSFRRFSFLKRLVDFLLYYTDCLGHCLGYFRQPIRVSDV